MITDSDRNSKPSTWIPIILSLFCCQWIWGQKVTVSEEITLRNDLSYDLIGKIDSQFVLFRDRGNKYEIKVFNGLLKQKEDQEIVLAEKNCHIIATIPGDTSFFIAYGYRSRGNYYVQADQFNIKGQLLSADTIKIFQDVLFNPEVKSARSEDRTKMIFFSIHEQHEMRAAAFDFSQRKELYDRSLLFNETDLREDFRAMLVTNKGDQIIVFEKNNFKSKKDKHVFEVHRFYAHTEQNQAFLIPVFRIVSFHSKFIYDNVNHQLIGGGIYSVKNFNRAEGIYHMKHSLLPGSAELVHMYPFENKFDEEIKRRSKEKNEFNHLQVSDIALKQDGGVLLITEIKKEYERRATYGGSASRLATPNDRLGFMLVDYYYEDMAVFSMKKDGTLEWSDILHKKQYSHDDDAIFSSYFLFKNPSKLRLVYNDEISTENTVSEYVIQANGQYQRKSVLSTEYVRLQLRFRDAIQIASNAFIVPSQRNLRLNLVKVEYL
jgi:hypothetical protein